MGLNRCVIDFESRSAFDIKYGASKYSKHKSTKILCLAFKINEDPVQIITEFCNYSDEIGELFNVLMKDNYLIEAHNSGFERAMWENQLVKKYKWPKIPFLKWRCSASKGSALALPRSLGGVAEALKMDIKKDMGGRRLMLKMAKPRKPTKNNSAIWNEDPEDFKRLYDYCKTDVLVEHLASSKMIDLSPDELETWQLDQTINSRGIYCDIQSVKIILGFIELYEDKLTRELQMLTGGLVKTHGQIKQILTWLDLKGFSFPGLTVAHVKEALKSDDLTPGPRRVLEIRQLLSKSSTKKFTAMINMADDKDQRIRDTLLFHGASTGRWSGKGIQPQNFPRGSISDVDKCLALVNDGDFSDFEREYPDVLNALSSLLRSMLCAPKGKTLACADFSAIEARVLLWLAGDERGLNIFRRGEDIYIDMASGIYKIPMKEVDKKKHRPLGKVAILGLGYGMGKDKFFDTCAAWGIPIERSLAVETVTIYRERFKKVKTFWYALEKAAVKAINNPGSVQTCGRLILSKRGEYLFIKLPSGRKIAYNSPVVKMINGPFGPKDEITFMGVNSLTKKWERQKTYGGKLVENVTQAVARDLMVYSMKTVEASGFPVIMTVHDELVCEVDESYNDLKGFESLVSMTPEWADGLPIESAGWIGKRYKK